MRRQVPRSFATVTVGFMLLALAGCGTQTSPGGNATTGPSTPAASVRPVTTQPVAQDGGLECPASITDREGMTVPEKPQGVDGHARLVPDRQPVSLVDCAYQVRDVKATAPAQPPFKLDKRTLVAGDRVDAVVGLLAWSPVGEKHLRGCTMIAGDEIVHLVGARYDDAIVWVSSLAEPNRCSWSTNGDVTSPASVGFQLEEWFGNRLGAHPATGACDTWSQGRLGDDRSLAPEGDPTVTVCRQTAKGTQATKLTPDQSQQVVKALRALHTRPTGHACTGGDAGSGTEFRLVLDYGRGPGVDIAVTPSCTPQLQGSALEAADAKPVVNLVEQWSPPVAGH